MAQSRFAAPRRSVTDMLNCCDCEFFHRRTDGTPHLGCDPFATVKEVECIQKWQLVQLTVAAQAHQATLRMYQRIAPLQEKMFRHMEREIDDVEESDRWKLADDDDRDDPFKV